MNSSHPANYMYDVCIILYSLANSQKHTSWLTVFIMSCDHAFYNCYNDYVDSVIIIVLFIMPGKPGMIIVSFHSQTCL